MTQPPAPTLPTAADPCPCAGNAHPICLVSQIRTLLDSKADDLAWQLAWAIRSPKTSAPDLIVTGDTLEVARDALKKLPFRAWPRLCREEAVWQDCSQHPGCVTSQLGALTMQVLINVETEMLARSRHDGQVSVAFDDAVYLVGLMKAMRQRLDGIWLAHEVELACNAGTRP